MAAVTNHHKLGGLKQQKFIFLHFWTKKFEIRVSAGLCPPPQAAGEGPSGSSSLWDSRHPLDAPLPFHSDLPSSSHCLLCVSPLLSLMETLVIGFRPHLKVLLITSAKTCFQIKSHPQTPGEDMEASFWGNHPNCWHLTVSQGRATKPEHHDCSSPTHIKVRKTEKPILRNFLDETIKMITSNKS